MKAAIVSNATMAKYGRWDVGFYVGSASKKLKEALKRARLDVRRAVDRVKAVERQLAEEEKRVAEMKAAGEVMEINEET